jgi:hypothetical protein
MEIASFYLVANWDSRGNPVVPSIGVSRDDVPRILSRGNLWYVKKLTERKAMFSKLFVSQTAPFILSLTLSILGWLTTNTISILSDVTILQYSQTRAKEATRVTVANASIKQVMTDAVLTFVCKEPPCFTSIDDPLSYVRSEHVVPYFIPQNKICVATPDSITAVLTLPPKAEFRFYFNERQSGKFLLMFAGFTKEMECPSSESILTVANLWIIKGCSLITLATGYYFHIFPILLLLTLVFLIVILLRPGPREKSYDT